MMLSKEVLDNTSWRVTHQSKTRYTAIFNFNSNGKLLVPNKNHINNTWAIRDGILIIKYNDAYVEYRGKLVGKEIIGEAINIKNLKWGFRLNSISPLNFIDDVDGSLVKLGNTSWHAKLSLTPGFEKIADERYFTLQSNGEVLLTKKSGERIGGKINWILNGSNLTIDVNDFAKYVGLIVDNNYIGELTNNKGKKLCFKAAKSVESFSTPSLNPNSINAMEVFMVEKYQDSERFHFLSPYIKYRLYGERNPDFDNHSSNILNLKRGEDIAITHFYNRLNAILSKEEFVICYVPSSDPENHNSGVRKLCSMLAKIKNRVDGTHCIVRTKKIDKLASGGNRSIHIQLNSLNIESQEVIKGKHILLLDDVI